MASESIKRKFKNRHKCWKKMPKIRKLIYDDDIWAITCKHSGKQRWDNMHGGKLALFYEKKESVWDCICTSYKEEDIETALKDFLMFGSSMFGTIKMVEL